jgi:hypothetical protein
MDYSNNDDRIMYNYIYDTHTALKEEEARLIQLILIQETEYQQYELMIKLRSIRAILESTYNFMIICSNKIQVIDNALPDIDDVDDNESNLTDITYLSDIEDLDNIDFEIQIME